MRLLLLPPHCPSPDFYAERSKDPRSKFLLDYAEAWVRQGHQVRVIHLPPHYPRIFNLVAEICTRWSILRTLQLGRFKQNTSAITSKFYEYAGIQILRHPIFKYIPHRALPTKQVRRIASQFTSIAKSTDWQADCILADYLSPSLPIAIDLAHLLKSSLFPILHQTDLHYFLQSPETYLPALNNCSGVLFRSAPMAERFKKAGLSNVRYHFLYSGLPDHIVAGSPRSKIRRLLYVGTLRKSKNVHLILCAFFNLRNEYPDLILDIIGNGEYENDLRSKVQELQLANCVNFLGKLPHAEVFHYMRHADALIMVSKESFGMVYIEAMSQGCLVVAAKGEGIDGIVKNEYNGFLVPLHDQNALSNMLKKIIAMPSEKVALISDRAIKTTNEMRNDFLAQSLLSKLMSG